MTYGIIQKVFKKLLQSYPYCGYDSDTKLYTFNNIQQAEQELIEEIKKEYIELIVLPLSFLPKEVVELKKLIGDNQE